MGEWWGLLTQAERHLCGYENKEESCGGKGEGEDGGREIQAGSPQTCKL